MIVSQILDYVVLKIQLMDLTVENVNSNGVLQENIKKPNETGNSEISKYRVSK